MKVQRREIEIYVAENGRAPFSEWLHSLRDIRARAKIRIRLDRTSLGNLGDCKSVGDGVCEMKINYGSGYRIYFGHVGNKVILLLCGGDKSSQGKDIKKAHVLWADYLGRSDDKE